MSSTETDDVTVVTPAELKERIDADEDVFLLDARAESEFAEWQIDGPSVESVNHPYFDLLDGIPDELDAELPDDRRLTVLCAKGGASEFVAEELDSMGYDVEHLEDGMNGWARLYERTDLAVDVDATVRQYRRPSSGCLAYLVVSEGEAAVIDPLRAFTDEYVADAAALGAELTHALDTHIHADHLSGIRELAEETDATPVLPTAAADRGVTDADAFDTIDDGETLEVGAVTVEAVHTPGHTSGMTAFALGDVLFTGDGLFTESIARPDLEDPAAARDEARTLHESLQERVLPRPDDTVIAPAHVGDGAESNDDGSATAELGELRERMPALTMDASEFVEFIVDDMPPRPANYEEIIAANLGTESPSDEEAFELELGPNNCAASTDATK